MNKSPIKIDLPADSQPSSLAARAFLAILLTIGFYGLALAIAGALLFIIYAEFAYLNRINLRITFFALIGAITILWAIAPRFDRFTPPGALLTPAKHPRLFKTIQSIADQVGQKMPAEVYLVEDVNAFVAERGGFMGIGKKRVMGIGLPLLQMLTAKQLEAILAHEFGHFYGGDTSLGPWIYNTRMAIIRTVGSLENKSILQAPFRWYGEMFLRITQAISRRQELVADALASAVAGAGAMIESLKVVHGLAPAYASYMQNEVMPLLNGGYRPPLSSGFMQYAQTKPITEAMANLVDAQLKESKSDPFDSHPALSERIRAIQSLPAKNILDTHTPAISLIDECFQLEQEMLATLYGGEKVRSLKSIKWEDVGQTVYLEAWKRTTAKYAEGLAGLTALNLPEYRSTEGLLFKHVAHDAPQPRSIENIQGVVDYVLGMALSVMMANAGWNVTATPGCDFTLVRNGKEVRSFEMVRSLANGSLTAEEWPNNCREQGLADLRLAQE